jgi:formylglycine-generating enzyme required for sulfatase activity
MRNYVRRGGSWIFYAWGCRAAFRFWGVPGRRDRYLGFRPAFRLKKKR